MNILITSAGRRVSLVKFFQMEVNKLFPGSLVAACDIDPSLSAACIVADINFTVPRIGDSAYIHELISKCCEHKIKLVIPTIDTELLLLAQHREDFAKEGIKVVVSSHDLIHKFANKKRMNSFFKSRGIPVPQEYSRKNYKFPFFIKPFNGSGSHKNYIIKNKDELNDYQLKDEKLMFLEYLDHSSHDEYTCDLYYGRDHQLKCVVPRKRIEVRSGEVSKGVTVKNELIPFINDRLSEIDGALGCLTSQFFLNKENGKIYGIEINSRFGGGFPLTYRAGANFVKWLLHEYLLEEDIPPQFENWEDHLLLLRYDSEIWVNEFKG